MSSPFQAAAAIPNRLWAARIWPSRCRASWPVQDWQCISSGSLSRLPHIAPNSLPKALKTPDWREQGAGGFIPLKICANFAAFRPGFMRFEASAQLQYEQAVINLPVVGDVRPSKSDRSGLPGGKTGNSPGQNAAQSRDSIPSGFSRPVGGAAKTLVTVRGVRPRSFRGPELDLFVFVFELRNRFLYAACTPPAYAFRASR